MCHVPVVDPHAVANCGPECASHSVLAERGDISARFKKVSGEGRWSAEMSTRSGGREHMRTRTVVLLLVALGFATTTYADVVTDWNTAALNAIRRGKTPPPLRFPGACDSSCQHL